MEALFLHLLNMALTATPLILLVMLVRLLMKRMPRWMLCLLWAVVAVRLLCPVSWESPIGLMPSQPPVTGARLYGTAGTILVPEIAVPAAGTVQTPLQKAPGTISLTALAAWVWAAGTGLMLLYLLVSCWRLRRQVREAVPLGGKVWLCDAVKTPFILGVFRPQIYLPSGIREQDLPFVIAHERAHLKRKDHCWKPLGFVLLAVYWFHPLLWAAYGMLSKDIELACDERVIRDLSMEEKKAYSTALLECSTVQRKVLACPVAFGEVAIRERIANILHYKKPGFWIVLLSLAAILTGAVCFLTVRPQAAAADAAVPEAPVIVPALTEAPQTESPALTQSPPETLPVLEDAWADAPDGIRIEAYQAETFTAQVMLIRDPAMVCLGTASDFSGKLPGKRLEEVMEEENILGAVNGGAFFDDGTSGKAAGATPLGLTYSQGSCLWETGDLLYPGFAGFTDDNILVVHNSEITREQAEALSIRDGCSYGPALIIGGEVNREVYEADSGYNPRTAIGQRADGTVIFICVNGRQAESLGCTYGDLTDMMLEYGAVSACNMTGGSATGMMYLDTYGAYGTPGEVRALTTYPIGLSQSRKLPTYWLIRPAEEG